MATTKESKSAKQTTQAVADEASLITNTDAEVVVNETKTSTKTKSTQTGPSYEELLSLVQQLASEVKELKANQSMSGGGVGYVMPAANTSIEDKTGKILEILANRKSDKEVVIVHNCELMPGLSTHIELTNLTIDLHTMGEQRLLSWQHFEECVSKYRSFFEREIILLSADEEELASTYNIPCVKRGDNYIMTHEDILKLPTMSMDAVESLINSLTDSDKDFLYSYWLGKAYGRVEGFYDRSKIERLNVISREHYFDNLLAYMNGDFRKTSEATQPIQA